MGGIFQVGGFQQVGGLDADPLNRYAEVTEIPQPIVSVCGLRL